MPSPEIAEAFVDAGWLDIDLLDAFDVIETGLQYLDDHESI